MTDIDALEALAKAATPGPWQRSQRPNGPFWHIHSDHTIDGKRCISGRQSIAAMHAENKKTGSKAYAAMFEANADYVAAANPAAVLALIAEVRALREFHGFFADRCEGLFMQFGMPAVDAYNKAARGAK